MSAIVTDLLAALPEPPSGCAPHVSVSYWTQDPTVLQVSYVGDPETTS